VPGDGRRATGGRLTLLLRVNHFLAVLFIVIGVALLVRTVTVHGGSVGYVIGVVFILLGVLRWRALH
jgi:drug/metabolite transporter (DMT)-like permease